MDKKMFVFTLVITLLVICLSSACSSSTSISTSTSTQATTQPVTSSQVTTSSVTTQANWWDKFGEPEYGDTLTLSARQINNAFDPYNWMTAQGHIYDYLWNPDWTADRSSGLFYRRLWLPDIWVGNVAESWEWENGQTLVVRLRPDVTWQNKAPMNGRLFTADDVVWHYDRMLGTGNGFTTPNPYFIGRIDAVKNVTARDKLTVVYNFKNPTLFMNSVSIISESQNQAFEAPEVWAMGSPVTPAGGDGPGGPPGGGPPGGGPPGGGGISGINSALNDWKNVVGIGPYMVTDFVANSTMIETRNPDYWSYDERHPENQLPYIETIKSIYLTDLSTQQAALRTGKIDYLSNIAWQQADSLKDTNPELKSGPAPTMGGFIFMRCDKEPFTDVNVRKVMQMAIDLNAIGQSIFGGYVEFDGKPIGFLSPAFKGWSYAYDDWPESLKEEFSYNPVKAKQILADAGYPNGFQTSCLASSAGNLDLLQVMKAYWADINVDVTINMADMGTMMQMMMAKKHDPLALMGSSEMPPQMGLSMFISSEPTNATVNNDPVFDAKVAGILGATSMEDAQKLVVEADKYYIEHHWIINTIGVRNFNFWQPYIIGYDGENMAGGDGNLIYARIWIDSALKRSMGR